MRGWSYGPLLVAALATSPPLAPAAIQEGVAPTGDAVGAVDSVGALAPGTYASRQTFSTVIKSPPLGRRQTGVTVSYALHELTREDHRLIASTRFCSVEPTPFGGVKSILSEAFVAAMPEPRVEVTVEGPADGPWVIHFQPWVMVLGAELEDPLDEPLPTDEDDPRITDPDGDGKPGVTVELSGLARGKSYVVQRLVRSLTGTLTPDGRLSGSVEGRAEQETIGASNPLLRRFKPEFLDETDPLLNTFVWLPVSRDLTCAELVTHSDALFPGDG